MTISFALMSFDASLRVPPLHHQMCCVRENERRREIYHQDLFGRAMPRKKRTQQIFFLRSRDHIHNTQNALTAERQSSA